MKNAALLLLAALFSSGCEQRIQQGLDEREANELQTVLVERGFLARKVLEPGKKPTFALTVDESQADDATRVLVELGLPRRRQPTGPELLKPGLVPSPTEELQARLLGLQGDLSQTLEGMEGVVAARVHLVMPPPPRPGAVPVMAKASALLRVRPGQGERVRGQAEDLRALIAGSVDGLAPSAVTVVVNEIATAVPAPKAPRSQLGRLRLLAAGLGAVVSVLAAVMALLVLRLRKLRVRNQVAVVPDAPESEPTPVTNRATGRAA